MKTLTLQPSPAQPAEKPIELNLLTVRQLRKAERQGCQTYAVDAKQVLEENDEFETNTQTSPMATEPIELDLSNVSERARQLVQDYADVFAANLRPFDFPHITHPSAMCSSINFCPMHGGSTATAHQSIGRSPGALRRSRCMPVAHPPRCCSRASLIDLDLPDPAALRPAPCIARDAFSSQAFAFAGHRS